MRNRRRHARAPLTASVTFRSQGGLCEASTETIGERGVFVATREVLSPGSLIDLEFALPDDESPIRVRGEVRWVSEPRDSVRGRPGMGVQFKNLREPDRARIERYVARHRQPEV
jgi:uncharacterized protein (TIGR02266 family)